MINCHAKAGKYFLHLAHSTFSLAVCFLEETTNSLTLDNKTVSMGRVVMEANLNRGVSSLSLYQDETYEQGINALGMKESRSSIRLKNGNELA